MKIQHIANAAKKYGFKVSKAEGFEEKSQGGNIARVFYSTETPFASQYEVWGDISNTEGRDTAKIQRLITRGRLFAYVTDSIEEVRLQNKHNHFSSDEAISWEEYCEWMNDGMAVLIIKTDGQLSVCKQQYYAGEEIVEIHTKKQVIVL